MNTQSLYIVPFEIDYFWLEFKIPVNKQIALYKFKVT